MRTLLIKNRRQIYTSLRPVSLLVAAIFYLAQHSLCQEEKKTVPNGTDGLVLTVPPADSVTKKLPPNEFVGAFSTLKLGMGYILDYAAYSQDDVFKQQMDSANLDVGKSKLETRDFRIMGSGVLKTKRPISWKFAYMYDGDDKVWMIRETGVTIGMPELAGHIFIGRTKEGYSMVKVMNGHSPWTAERQMALDVVPILADGIKWFGYLPKQRIFWNLGYFNDLISKGQGFSTYKSQFSGRVGWMPLYDKASHKVIHFATNIRYGKPLDGKIALKSRPESNPFPQIINTGSFQTDNSYHIGAELYYSNARFLIGSEVMMHSFQSKEFEDHKFYGGDVVVTYLLTGGKRPYNTVGSFFGFIQVQDPVTKGGWGAWEIVVRASTLDLDDGSIKGGKFFRITPMVNWYMSRNFRLEFIYGYGVLNRYGLEGKLQIYQARLQISVL